MIERLAELVNGDENLVRRGRFLNVDFLIEVGARAYHVSVREGRIAGIDQGPKLMRAWRFAIRADDEAWNQFWQPLPKPGYHDIFAMTKRGRAVVEGDLQPLMANLRYLKEVIAAPRRLARSA
jgi:hypothetical protein